MEYSILDENFIDEEIQNKILALKQGFDKCSEDIESFIKTMNDEKNEKYLDGFRDIVMIKNINFNEDLEWHIIFSILHFYALSEINGILFALLEEIKKSAHYIFMNDSRYNKDKNFYNFFLDLVIYDSSQINFNYLSSLFSNTIITLIDVTPTYFLCILFNTSLLFFSLFFPSFRINR